MLKFIHLLILLLEILLKDLRLLLGLEIIVSDIQTQKSMLRLHRLPGIPGHLTQLRNFIVDIGRYLLKILL